VGRSQLRDLGLSHDTIPRWVKEGYLHRVHPGVYAVGHRAPTPEGDLSAALLYAGPGAMLSHATAAWWLGLIDKQPRTIHVSTPRRCRSRRGLHVHAERSCDRFWHNGLTVTTVAQTLLDYASVVSFDRVRRALAEADYKRLLELDQLKAVLGHGRRGSANLRKALERHQPKLAMTRSRLEEAFVVLCESACIPLPEVNVVIEGWTVDALWRRERLVVELDGHKNHSSPAQIERDRQKELHLRAAGLRVNRYTRMQLTDEAALVAQDVLRSLRAPAP
jgi:predicted transcriptional regulator of viral defense system